MELLIRSMMIFLFNSNDQKNDWSLGNITIYIHSRKVMDEMIVIEYAIKNKSNGKVCGGKNDIYSFAASIQRLFNSVQ